MSGKYHDARGAWRVATFGGGAAPRMAEVPANMRELPAPSTCQARSQNSNAESISDIAAAMEVNQPAVSKTMKSLAELNAITVQNDTGDARRRIVHLTAAGSDLLSRARSLMHPVADLTFDPLTDRRLDQLLDTLTRIRTRLDTARQ